MIPFTLKDTVTFKKNASNDAVAAIPTSHLQFFIRDLVMNGTTGVTTFAATTSGKTVYICDSCEAVGNPESDTFTTTTTDAHKLALTTVASTTGAATGVAFKSTASIGEPMFLIQDKRVSQLPRFYIVIANAAALDNIATDYVCRCLTKF